MQILESNLLFRDGKYIAFSLLLFTLFSIFFFKLLLILIIPFFIFSLYFFRNPNRSTVLLNDKSIIICPSDGKVVDISKGDFEGYIQKISIFLSPLDVHVNWLPCDGKIKKINYRNGKFVVAFAPKSSEINERNDVIIQCNNGKEILVRQIAGFVARRICCWIKEADEVKAGQKYGMIRFGSRVDILLPENVEIMLSLGDKTKGGETPLGRWL